MMLAVVRLPMAQSVPSTAITGQVTSAIRPLNRCQIFFVAGFAYVKNLYFAGETCCGKDRIVIQELMQTVDDIHPMAHRLKHQAALVL